MDHSFILSCYHKFCSALFEQNHRDDIKLFQIVKHGLYYQVEDNVFGMSDAFTCQGRPFQSSVSDGESEYRSILRENLSSSTCQHSALGCSISNLTSCLCSS